MTDCAPATRTMDCHSWIRSRSPAILWLAFLLLLQVTAGDPLSFSLLLLSMTGRVAVSFLMWQGKKLSIIQLNKTQYIYGANNRHFMSSADEGLMQHNTLYNLVHKTVIHFYDWLCKIYTQDVGVNKIFTIEEYFIKL